MFILIKRFTNMWLLVHTDMNRSNTLRTKHLDLSPSTFPWKIILCICFYPHRRSSWVTGERGHPLWGWMKNRRKSWTGTCWTTGRLKRSRKMTKSPPVQLFLLVLLTAPFSLPPRLTVTLLFSFLKNSLVHHQMVHLPQPPWTLLWHLLWSWATSGKHSLGSSASIQPGSRLSVNRGLLSYTEWDHSCTSVTAAVRMTM